MSTRSETPGTTQRAPRSATLGFAEVMGAIPRVFGRTWRGLVLADLAFKAFGALLTLGFISVVVTEVMALTGRSAVTNTDIAAFLTYRMGLLLAFVGASGALFLIMVEQAVLLAVAAILTYHPGMTLWQVAKVSGAAVQRILRLAGLLVLITLAITLPPVLVSALLYKLTLGGHDINFYLSSRPPAFLAVAAVASVLLLGAAAALAVFYVRGVLAVPILLFERLAPVTAIRESFARTRGVSLRVAALLALWHGSWFVISWLCLAGFRHLAGLGLNAATESTAQAVFTAATAVVGLGLLAAVLSFGSSVGYALLQMKLYARLHPEGVKPDRVPEPSGGDGQDGTPFRRIALAALVVLVAILAVSMVLATKLSRLGHAQITAHRGYSKVAPENSLSAIRKAIEAGADWAEIDAQETSDGVVIVTHDRDLMRMAGDPRRLTEIAYADLRSIDVGSKFGPAFAGERVPTLEEAIALARGKIKLNIELKYYGDAPRLAADVAGIIRKNAFEKECFVASLDYPKLAEAKRENPALRTGAIVAAGVGDLSKLEADVLSVGANQIDFWFMRNARRAGKEVHVWTVDDPRVAKLLMGRGVTNIITNDPALIIRARREWEALSPAQKLVLTSRYLFGLGDAEGMDKLESQGDL